MTLMLSERGQTPKTTDCMIYLHDLLRIGKFIETENRIRVTRV